MSINRKYGVIIQARMSSSRLPGKVLMDVEGKPMLFRQADRLGHELKGIPLIIATSSDVSDDGIEEFCSDYGFQCFRGPLNDVMLRFVLCAKTFDIDYIIRVGGDDPLIDPQCCGTLIDMHNNDPYEFMYASNREGWPYGCAAELISREALESIHSKAKDNLYKEHIIPYFFDHPDEFSILRVKAPKSICRPEYYFSVDYQEDVELIREIFSALIKEGDYFPLESVIRFVDENPEIKAMNKHLHNGFDR